MRFSHLFYLEYIRTKPNEPTRIEWRKYKNKLKNDYGYEQENSKYTNRYVFFVVVCLSYAHCSNAQMLNAHSSLQFDCVLGEEIL